MMKVIEIGNKTYRCNIAETEEEKQKGLQGVEHLPVDEGLLFVWDNADTREMWMKDCSLELDIIGINEDDEVNAVITGIPNDETLLPFPSAKYILEVNANSGIEIGDEFDIDEEQNLDKYTMKILAPDGSAQMLLQGNERIFSRISTRKFIKWAKKAEAVKEDPKKYESYCKRLGKLIFKELNAQDNREPEYVSVKE